MPQGISAVRPTNSLYLTFYCSWWPHLTKIGNSSVNLTTHLTRSERGSLGRRVRLVGCNSIWYTSLGWDRRKERKSF